MRSAPRRMVSEWLDRWFQHARTSNWKKEKSSRRSASSWNSLRHRARPVADRLGSSSRKMSHDPALRRYKPTSLADAVAYKCDARPGGRFHRPGSGRQPEELWRRPPDRRRLHQGQRRRRAAAPPSRGAHRGRQHLEPGPQRQRGHHPHAGRGGRQPGEPARVRGGHRARAAPGCCLRRPGMAGATAREEGPRYADGQRRRRRTARPGAAERIHDSLETTKAPLPPGPTSIPDRRGSPALYWAAYQESWRRWTCCWRLGSRDAPVAQGVM
jgi:hypothetical protein